jgi:hypothetical protein
MDTMALKYIVLVAMSFCSIIYSYDSTMLLSELKSDLIMRANDFAKLHSKGIMQPIFWEQAYTAYVFKKLKEEQLQFSELMEISGYVKTKSSWETLIKSEMPSLSYKILSYNAQNINEYHKLACTQWSKQQESLEKDWKEFASRYPSNQN